MNNQDFKTIIETYLSLGWSLIPILPDKKIPAYKWKKYQFERANLDTVLRWVNKGLHLALVTGQISGVAVVDDDRVKQGLEEYGLTSNIISQSRSGGKHYYYKYDREITQSINRELHIDIKAKGGYVLLPPFNERKWVIAPTAERIKNLPSLSEEKEKEIRYIPKGTFNEAGVLEISEYLAVTDGNGRKDHLHQLACKLFYKLPKEDALLLLQAINTSYKPPLTEEEFNYNVGRAWGLVQKTKGGEVLLGNIKKKVVDDNESGVAEAEGGVGAPKLEKPPLKIVSLQEFCSTKFPKEVWLIDKLLREGGVSYISGQSGVGKSLVTLSIIKAISEGTYWIDPKFKANKRKILIIDKENPEVDLQNNIVDSGFDPNNTNVELVSASEFFNILDKKGNITPEAIELSNYVKEHNIDIVVLDSQVDFYVGDENNSIDFSMNILAWKQLFADKTVIVIHHEIKPQVGSNRSALSRMRGSGNIGAQPNSVISLSSTEQEPTHILVEHAKARGGAKQKPFLIEMVVKPEYITGRTMVTGFKYLGEVAERKTVNDTARESVLKFLKDHPHDDFTRQEIIDATKSTLIGILPISKAVTALRNDSLITATGNGSRGNEFRYSYPEEAFEEDIKNI